MKKSKLKGNVQAKTSPTKNILPYKTFSSEFYRIPQQQQKMSREKKKKKKLGYFPLYIFYCFFLIRDP